MLPQTSHGTHQKRSRRSSYEPPNPDVVKVVSLTNLLRHRRSLDRRDQAELTFGKGGPDPELWCVGDTELLQGECVAIVGTREVSLQGVARARRLARELAQAGVVVVSGLAKGVDTEALSAAIGAGGRVVAVIGTPVTRAYPAENAKLQEEIAREHLLVSQFAPGARVFPSNFPDRNKLMAALTDATAIIEAGETSGTLHQAAECVRLGRWLFITKSTMEDAALTWPNKFRSNDNVRALSTTSDLLRALRD